MLRCRNAGNCHVALAHTPHPHFRHLTLHTSTPRVLISDTVGQPERLLARTPSPQAMHASVALRSQELHTSIARPADQILHAGALCSRDHAVRRFALDGTRVLLVRHGARYPGAGIPVGPSGHATSRSGHSGWRCRSPASSTTTTIARSCAGFSLRNSSGRRRPSARISKRPPGPSRRPTSSPRSGSRARKHARYSSGSGCRGNPESCRPHDWPELLKETEEVSRVVAAIARSAKRSTRRGE